MDSSKDNLEEWIDLDGTRTLWLKIGFNQKYIPPITHLEFLYMPFEAENLVYLFIINDLFKYVE